jgi:hypothetical protein
MPYPPTSSPTSPAAVAARPTLRFIQREGEVCAHQLDDFEQAHAIALVRAGLVYSTKNPRCGRRHYRPTS